MPAKVIHKMFERKLLRYSNDKVDELMDIAWVFAGHRHREVWGHDPLSIMLISYLAGGDRKKNFQQALLHIMLDKSFSKMKKQLIESGVEPSTADVMLYYIAKSILKHG